MPAFSAVQPCGCVQPCDDSSHGNVWMCLCKWKRGMMLIFFYIKSPIKRALALSRCHRLVLISPSSVLLPLTKKVPAPEIKSCSSISSFPCCPVWFALSGSSALVVIFFFFFLRFAQLIEQFALTIVFSSECCKHSV